MVSSADIPARAFVRKDVKAKRPMCEVEREDAMVSYTPFMHCGKQKE